ncbi:MAG: ABC transporter substrate-binding protein [Coriobacteriales bacterium]|nr:ABC transporter substrate-binding protein [Coriobacteriales bacterium]
MSKRISNVQMMNRRRFIAAMAAAGITCGAAMSGFAFADENKDSEKDAFPVTIKHAFGETTIEAIPERVVTAGWSVHDVPLALGIAPVACEAANFGIVEGQTLLPWSEKAYKKLGVEPITIDNNDGYDFEAISDARPDVILCTYSGVTEEDYKELSKIAPTVPYPEVAWSIPWRTNIQMCAAALGKVKEGDKLIEDLEKLMAD